MEAFASGLTNEGCFDGKYRLLQNNDRNVDYSRITTRLALQGEEVGFGEWVTLARRSNGQPNMDSSKIQFRFSWRNGNKKIKEWCKVSGQRVPQTKGQIVRVVLESLALTI